MNTPIKKYTIFLYFVSVGCSYLIFVIFAEKFPPQVVPGGHRGVSQEQILLPLRRVLRWERRRSLRGSSDMSRSVSSCMKSPSGRLVCSLLLVNSESWCVLEKENRLYMIDMIDRKEVWIMTYYLCCLHTEILLLLLIKSFSSLTSWWILERGWNILTALEEEMMF